MKVFSMVRTFTSPFPQYACPVGVAGMMPLSGGRVGMVLEVRGPAVALPGTLGLMAGFPDDYDRDGERLKGVESPLVTARREAWEEMNIAFASTSLNPLTPQTYTLGHYGNLRYAHHDFFWAWLGPDHIAGIRPKADEVTAWHVLAEEQWHIVKANTQIIHKLADALAQEGRVANRNAVLIKLAEEYPASFLVEPCYIPAMDEAFVAARTHLHAGNVLQQLAYRSRDDEAWAIVAKAIHRAPEEPLAEAALPMLQPVNLAAAEQIITR